jgi:hypothetical protein
LGILEFSGDNVLSWNQKKVQNLNGTEIWLFIIARVLVGFGAGALLERYSPRIAGPIAIPVLLVGFVLFAIAAKGLRRQPSETVNGQDSS